ncbi:hypothetical protein HHI36_006006 [Cryptolaemus montrouzieri]|uniref:Ionotropic receptor n=1 Tax=Cryptolaemus montrouzieri TaxID=559131 RepID=A0ABD2NX76_9CUCU
MLANIYSQVHFSYWLNCLNFMIQSVVDNGTKCIVLVDTNINLNYPVINYDSKHEMAEHFSDLRPEIYIVDLDRVPIKEFMKIITKCYNYNPEAMFIVKTINDSFGFQEFSPRFIRHMIHISEHSFNFSLKYSNEGICSDLENEEVCGHIFQKNLGEKNIMENSTLKVCHVYLLPYFMCLSSNCDEKSGLNFDITGMIMEHLKLNFEYVFNDYIYKWKASELLLSGSCDLVVVELAISIDGGEVNFIYNVNDDYDRWVVPRARKVPKWRYLFEVFSIQLWIIWFSFMLVAILEWRIFDYIFTTNKLNTEPVTIKNKITQSCMSLLKEFYRIIKVFLEQTVRIEIHYFHQLISLAITLFLIFMMNNLYKGRFTYLLLGTNHYPEEIKSFDDILDKKLYLTSTHFRLQQLEEQFPKIKNYSFYLSNLGDGSKWLNYVAFRKDTAALKSTTEIKYVSENYLDEDGISLIRVLDLIVAKLLKGAVYLRGNPIFSDINKYVNELRDHGFVHYILSKYEKVDYHVLERRAKYPEIMTFHDLTGPIAVWMIGFLVSILVFFLERMKLNQ